MSSNTPKIFVGTMSCEEEAGLERCIRSVSKQKNVDVTHVVISNLGEKSAHDKLYSTWQKFKNDFDAFVQIDNDTSLMGENTLYAMFTHLQNSMKLSYTSIQVPLRDFFQDRNIMGLNMYSKAVSWTESKNLWCDRCTVNNVTQTNSPYHLIPAGNHALNPTKIQAIRYGIHRGLKRGGVSSQDFAHTLDAYKKNPCAQRMWALYGFINSSEFSEFSKIDYSSLKNDVIMLTSHDEMQRAVSRYVR